MQNINQYSESFRCILFTFIHIYTNSHTLVAAANLFLLILRLARSPTITYILIICKKKYFIKRGTRRNCRVSLVAHFSRLKPSRKIQQNYAKYLLIFCIFLNILKYFVIFLYMPLLQMLIN